MLEGSESYLISPLEGVNVKIRNETLDIKLLRAVNDNRLEQWEPVFKKAFPLDVHAIREVYSRWALAGPESAEGEYSSHRFFSELVEPEDSLCSVSVQKKRRGYQLSGASLELTDLIINGIATKTVCVEHADAALVASLIRDFQFDHFENMNYVTAIRRIVEGEGL